MFAFSNFFLLSRAFDEWKIVVCTVRKSNFHCFVSFLAFPLEATRLPVIVVRKTCDFVVNFRRWTKIFSSVRKNSHWKHPHQRTGFSKEISTVTSRREAEWVHREKHAEKPYQMLLINRLQQTRAAYKTLFVRRSFTPRCLFFKFSITVI